MIRFSVLASGSSGNACYIETFKAKVIIDAGLSCREMMRRFEMIGVSPRNIDALVITHEHSDHIKGAGPIARRFDIPVFSNRHTLTRGMKVLGDISRPVAIHTGQTITIKDLEIETFTKCHDAVDPMGLVVSSNGSRLGLITDLGRSTRLVEERLKGCMALIIEFNHDLDMLDNGSYPLNVRRRIRGQEGHLSNKQAGELLMEVAHGRLKKVILAHISKENNLPEKAYKEAEEALARSKTSSPEILISRQDRPMALMEI